MIFVDTWAWLALAHRRDPWHDAAVREHRRLQRRNVQYITSDYVLAETISPLFGVLDFEQARQFLQGVFSLIHTGRYQLVFVSPDRFELAWQMRQKYHDKPDISFVDFTSMVVMQELGLTDVFTGDAHFRQVGMGFCLRPE